MRIVSLLPSATEIVFAIGAGNRLVGVTHECDFPPAARALPAVTASLLPPELQTQLGTVAPQAGWAERIDRHVRASVHAGSSLYALDDVGLAALAPDLIITQELCAVCAVSYDSVARAARRLRGEGPAIVSLEPSSLADVYANIATIGELCGAADGARGLIATLRARENVLRASAAAAPQSPGVLVLEWTEPPMSGGHWTPELVELAGGHPLLAHPGANSERLDWAAIAAADPDIVVAVPCGYDLPHARAAVADLAVNPVWRALRAVRDGRAYVMDGNAYVNRPGPRLLDSAEILARAIAGRPAPGDAIETVEAPVVTSTLDWRHRSVASPRE